jgi:hypothetical protein
MSLFRWDSDSRTHSVVGLVMLAVSGYIVVTTDQTYYLHLPALWGVIVGAYILLDAVMPDLRGAGGLRRRALAAALFWTSTIVALVLLWRVGF